MIVCGRYYPLFGLMANVALIFSGQYVKYVSGLRATSLAPGTLLVVVLVVVVVELCSNIQYLLV